MLQNATLNQYMYANEFIKLVFFTTVIIGFWWHTVGFNVMILFVLPQYSASGELLRK